MTHFTESILEETAFEWLGRQQTACGNSAKRILVLVGEVRAKDIREIL